jgi:hypothetical protein
MSIIEKTKQWVIKANEYGIPLPLVRINNAPTITGTMVVISFNTALLGQIGKVTNILGEIDLTQSNYLFAICLSAYLGRKIIGNKDNTTIEK